jgi:hypothetical protein
MAGAAMVVVLVVMVPVASALAGLAAAAVVVVDLLWHIQRHSFPCFLLDVLQGAESNPSYHGLG